MTVVRLGIMILVAFAVLAEGAVEPWSQAVLEVCVMVLLALWGLSCLRARSVEIHGSWAYPPMLALYALALLQWLGGRTAYPYATKVELLRFSAYVTLGFLAVQSFRTAEELTRLASMIMGLSFSVSLFAILQYFTFNGRLYWFHQLPLGGLAPFGPYINPNHFAGFVELTAPITIAALLSGAMPREKLTLAVLCAALAAAALVLSGSRGGLASFGFELMLLCLLASKQRNARRWLLTAAGLIVAASLLVLWLGTGRMTGRFQSTWATDLLHERRISVMKDTWRIFLSHPWAGTGLGTFQSVYPRYETYYDGLVADHAHNDYLELLAETGLLGGACALGFVAVVFWEGRRHLHLAGPPMTNAFYSGAFVACSGLLLHSFVDFNLHIPANAQLFFLLAFLLAAPSKAQSGIPRAAKPLEPKSVEGSSRDESSLPGAPVVRASC